MSKRLTLAAILPILFIGTFLTVDTLAASCGGVETSIINCSETDGEGSINHVLVLVLDILSMGIGITGVVGILIVGVQLLTSSDDVTKATKTKHRLLAIVVGLACYSVLWLGLRWLLPGGSLNAGQSDNASTSNQTVYTESTDNISPTTSNSHGDSDINSSTVSNNNATPSETNSTNSANPSDSSNSTNSNNSTKTEGSNKGSSNKQDKATSKQKIIIILGASQIKRIAGNTHLNLKQYTSKSGNKYSVSKGTLNFLYVSGTGFGFQSGSGWKQAEAIINKYSKKKDDVTFYVFFTLVGNDIKQFECDDIKTSNQTLISQIKKYNSLITKKQSEGYQVKGYVTSTHPVEPSNPNKAKAVVKNSSKNKCAKSYRSNYKFKLFNTVMKSLVAQQSALTYIETFDHILDSKYQFTKGWQDYKTVDGFHWDKATAAKYFNLWMSQVREL